MKVIQSSWQRVIAAVAIAAASFIVGANLSTTPEAHGEINPAPEQPSFQSGGQLSVPILREIAGTLRQMDGRLARLETAAQKMQLNSGRGAGISRSTAGSN